MGLYSVLNLGGELFVHQLGCGCHRGFNTNSLTLLVGAAIAVIVLAGCVMSIRSVRKGLRFVYVILTFGTSTILILAFVFFNAWA